MKDFSAYFSVFMRRIRIFFICQLLFLSADWVQAQITVPPAASAAEVNPGKWVLVIHGGAGGPAKGTMPAELEQEYLKQLDEALKIGTDVLEKGGNSLDAVEKVIRFMEDCPMFNAGKGAVLNEDGKAELDASVMDGKTGMAGAVAGVTTIRNPITAARLVMEKSNTVLLAGTGAEKFARTRGLDMADPAYFITPEQMKAWEKWKAGRPVEASEKEKKGTVGAVALDQSGNLAAGTSTGGRMGKLTGRIGDSPIIGAGTYANNQTCAVSATGHGEFFIRNVIAYDMSALMAYRGLSVEDAGNAIIMKKLVEQKGSGGLIAVDKEGNICMPFNTNAMFRAWAKSTGEKSVAIY